jgi:hypothetical protein
MRGLGVTLVIPGQVTHARVPAASVRLDHHADVEIGGVDDPPDRTPARQRDLPPGLREPAGGQRREQCPFQLAVWRDVAGSAIVEHPAECANSRLPPRSAAAETSASTKGLAGRSLERFLRSSGGRVT